MLKTYRIYFLAFIAGLSACTADEVTINQPPSTELDGKYNWQSTVISKPVDLDLDGNSSTNFIAETHLREDTMHVYFLWLETIEHSIEDRKFYDQRIFLWSPLSNLVSIEGKDLFTAYGLTNLLAKYKFSQQTKTIDIIGNLGSGYVDSVRLINNTILEVKYRQYFYTSNGWEELSLTSAYMRAE